MLYLDSTFEDLRILAENPSKLQKGPWKVRLIHLPTREERQKEWTDTQLSAVLFLAIADDTHPLAEALYKIAEPAIADLPFDFRPIP